MSIAYYENHARTFFDDTCDTDMGPLHARFLEHVPDGGHILDAGCGSGRDAKAFAQGGYLVTAFDGSPEMARMASEHVGGYVSTLTFAEMAFVEEFDGVWASASLLHVPMSEMVDTVRRLGEALVPGGVLFASFKYGHGEWEVGDRRYTDLNEESLDALAWIQPELTTLDIWVTQDQRPDRAEEMWANALFRKITRSASDSAD